MVHDVINQTMIDFTSKKQNTVETSTHGSEFVAARTATDQVIDLRLTLRYMGVPINRSETTNRWSSIVALATETLRKIDMEARKAIFYQREYSKEEFSRKKMQLPHHCT